MSFPCPYAEMSVRFKKKRDVFELRYGQTISSRSFSASGGTSEWPRKEGWESGHTIKDSCYRKEKGAEKAWGGGGW